MKLILKALAFAAWKHRKQKRKYNGLPYIVHPIHVAWIVSRVTRDEEIIAAALLHDTVEDTDTSIWDILRNFGARVGVMVSDLTDISKPQDGNRAARKAKDLRHTASANANSKTIKLADLIANTGSILKYDKDFSRTYLKEKILLLEVLKDGNPILYTRAKNQAEAGLKLLENT